MLLESLYEFAQTVDELPSMGYGSAKVAGLIHLDGSNNYVYEPLETIKQRGKKQVKVPGKYLEVPEIRRNGCLAKPISDTAEYIYEGGREGYREAYLQLLKDCWEATQEPSVQAVLDYCQNTPVKPDDIEFGDRIAFFWVDEGCLITDIPTIKQWWQERCQPNDAPISQCLVTGKPAKIAQKQAIQLKNIPGGNSSGASLISSYGDAFQSYGVKQASPISISADNDIHQVLNWMLANPERCLRIGEMAILLWGTTFGGKELADVEACQRYLKTPFSPDSKRSPVVNLLMLCGNAGRVSIREWQRQPEEKLRSSLSNWLGFQQIPGWNTFESYHYLSIYQLSRAPYRMDEKKILNRTIKALLNNALWGQPLPISLVQNVCERNRIEKGVTWTRAVFLNLYLQLYKDGQSTMELDRNHAMAFNFGRLLATYAKIQRAAQKCDLSKTNAAQAFGTAGMSPVTLALRLASNANNHLQVISRKSGGGLAHYFESQLAELNAEIAELIPLPSVFSIEQQAYFSMGYWSELHRKVTKDEQPEDAVNSTETASLMDLLGEE